eukprot:630930-Pelagomonas_calceolata.AAC.5
MSDVLNHKSQAHRCILPPWPLGLWKWLVQTMSYRCQKGSLPWQQDIQTNRGLLTCQRAAAASPQRPASAAAARTPCPCCAPGLLPPLLLLMGCHAPPAPGQSLGAGCASRPASMNTCVRVYARACVRKSRASSPSPELAGLPVKVPETQSKRLPLFGKAPGERRSPKGVASWGKPLCLPVSHSCSHKATQAHSRHLRLPNSEPLIMKNFRQPARVLKVPGRAELSSAH